VLPDGGRGVPYSLVLGAGGRPGLAYLAGTLLALELHGWTPDDAVSITGTSAGSLATAFLATGGTVEDLAAHTTAATPREAFRDTAAAIVAAEHGRIRVDLAALRHLVDVRRASVAASHLRGRRFVSALATMAPGLFELRRRLAFLDLSSEHLVAADRWRIVAAELNGRRYVFRPGEAPLSIAVAASCAIPSVFAPISHAGRRLVDGGVHSTTNADLAIDDPADVVVVLAPMCARTGGEMAFAPAQRALRAEVAELRRAGKHVVVFAPSTALRRVMGRNPLAAGRGTEITRHAFLEASDTLGELGPPRRHRPAASPAIVAAS